MKPVRDKDDYSEMSPAILFKSLSTHTRELIVTDNFEAKDKLHQYRREIQNSSAAFACIWCSENGIRNNSLRTYDRGFPTELLQLFSKMSSIGGKRRMTRSLLLLYLGHLTTMEAETLVYILKITKPNFSLKIFMDAQAYAMIKRDLPFQHQLLCDSVNSITYLDINNNNAFKHELKLRL